MHTTQTSSLCVTGWRVYFGSLLLQLSTVNKAVWGENPALSKQVLLMEYTCEYKFWCVHWYSRFEELLHFVTVDLKVIVSANDHQWPFHVSHFSGSFKQSTVFRCHFIQSQKSPSSTLDNDPQSRILRNNRAC